MKWKIGKVLGTLTTWMKPGGEEESTFIKLHHQAKNWEQGLLNKPPDCPVPSCPASFQPCPPLNGQCCPIVNMLWHSNWQVCFSEQIVIISTELVRDFTTSVCVCVCVVLCVCESSSIVCVLMCRMWQNVTPCSSESQWKLFNHSTVNIKVWI